MILDLFIYIIQFYINQNTFLPGFIIRKEQNVTFHSLLHSRFHTIRMQTILNRNIFCYFTLLIQVIDRIIHHNHTVLSIRNHCILNLMNLILTNLRTNRRIDQHNLKHRNQFSIFSWD